VPSRSFSPQSSVGYMLSPISCCCYFAVEPHWHLSAANARHRRGDREDLNYASRNAPHLVPLLSSSVSTGTASDAVPTTSRIRSHKSAPVAAAEFQFRHIAQAAVASVSVVPRTTTCDSPIRTRALHAEDSNASGLARGRDGHWQGDAGPMRQSESNDILTIPLGVGSCSSSGISLPLHSIGCCIGLEVPVDGSLASGLTDPTGISVASPSHSRAMHRFKASVLKQTPIQKH
jgi:hypothetical protein